MPAPKKCPSKYKAKIEGLRFPYRRFFRVVKARVKEGIRKAERGFEEDRYKG